MADVYEIITNRIIKQLEAGTVPWHKTWKAGPHGWPKNLVSKKDYRGVNVLLLSCSMYELPYWVSFKQAKGLGGHVRKGEKSTPVVFWKWYEPQGGEADPKTGRVERRPLLRHYNVFNVAQCDGLDQRIPETNEDDAEPFEPIAECERIVQTMPQRPQVNHGTIGAFYRASDDTVNMPYQGRFNRPEAYYSTLFHELTHSTGHPSRLNRQGIAESSRFGSGTYSREELIAEMGAAFLCGHTAIENATIDDSANYVAIWLGKLKQDKRLIVQVAAQAQKAVDLILGRTYEA